ncbi:energy transducer TonB, partial [Myxococcota bacterium]|nr:energy transducer TonB [Myxococcota bacterium]
GEGIATRWIAPGKSLSCGDSHLYPILFPLPRPADPTWEFTPEKLRNAKRQGLIVKNNNGAASWGVPLFSNGSKKGWIMRLAPGMIAHVGEKVVKADKETVRVSLPKGASGHVTGLAGWSLTFRVEPRPRVSLSRDSIVTPFFLQALIYGATFVTGILFIGFISIMPEPVVRDLPSTVRRFASVNKVHKASKKARIKEEPPPPKKIRPVLRSALANRHLRYRTKQAKTVRKIRMAAFFKQQRSFVQRRSPDDPVDLDRPGSDNNGTTGTTLPPSGPVELNVPVTPIMPVPVAPVAPTKVERPKPYIKVKPLRVSFPVISYPDSAKHLGIEGKVTLRLTIGTKGTVLKVEVMKKLHPLLDRTARNAALKARFKAARDQYGDPIVSTVTISITFKLEEEEE